MLFALVLGIQLPKLALLIKEKDIIASDTIDYYSEIRRMITVLKIAEIVERFIVGNGSI